MRKYYQDSKQKVPKSTLTTMHVMTEYLWPARHSLMHADLDLGYKMSSLQLLGKMSRRRKSKDIRR